MRKFFFLFLLFALSFFPISLPAQTDKTVSVSGPYADAGRNLAWGTTAFNRNFILTPPSPDQSMCIFVSNNNPTSAHTFTFASSQTGDPAVVNYQSQPGRWIDDTVQGSLSPVAASGTTSVYVHSTHAAKIALRFSGATTQAGTPDTADVYVVFTNSTSCGPVNSGQSGPIQGQDMTSSSSNTKTITTSTGRGSGAMAGTGVLGVSPIGREFSDLSRNLTGSGSTIIEIASISGDLKDFNTCHVYLNSVAGSGTSPTLNVYIQVGGADGIFTDRISFNQVTTGASQQEAAISSGSLSVTVFTDSTLAGGSIRDGTFPGRVRVKYVVGGTSPVFNPVSVRAVCK
jgi:hypothetical protein